MDTVDRETRSKIMSRVGQKDTGAELKLRKALHRLGFRYRLHDRSLPGSPDLVLPKYRSVIFVHGCYWHRHGCYMSTMPKSREAFWSDKFKANKERDIKSIERLKTLGWRVSVVWECSLRGKSKLTISEVVNLLKDWLISDIETMSIPSKNETKCK